MRNVLKYNELLEGAGFSKNQTAIALQVLEDAMTNELATKNELKNLELKTDVGFKEVHAKMDAGFKEVHAKMDAGFKEVHAKMDAGFKEVHAKMDAGFIEVHSKIDKNIAETKVFLILALGTFLSLGLGIAKFLF